MRRTELAASLANFEAVAQQSLGSHLSKELEKLNESLSNEDKMQSYELDGFQKLFDRFMKNKNKKIAWDDIRPPNENVVRPYSTLKHTPPEKVPDLLNKLVVLKLNGGLGTTMGCTGPKSAIEVRNDQTFLDMTVRQIENLNETYGCDVPLFLMNSFNTHSDTAKILRKYQHHNVSIHTFNQSRYPRLMKDTFLPVPLMHDTANEISHADWYPPGHGDLFVALKNSGFLEALLRQGKEYLFISNVDNLGATVDIDLLYNVAELGCEYCMEVTNKTRADIKGGTLVEMNGAVKLLEVAQVPSEHMEDFKSVKKFKIFNTNNLWVNLKAIDRVLQQPNFEPDIIVNQKEVNGYKVIQLETACGAAIEYFNNAMGVNVPRSRFLPVKSCSDLFLVQSDLYALKSGTLTVNPKRQFDSIPLVQLGDHFRKVSDYMSRIPYGAPSIIDLDHLTVSGDVVFGKGVQLRGTVIIVCNPGHHITIPDGAILENKVVTGNLHILEH
eukprot:TRINITY_DN11178_c0_g1::TRINITY_DN11178_c0_g1_i1::g.6509::m.6509 TRINITY_DN11178_c0_g1::TRINITY_DN11178_c0_g1_i1::g.6509  ORF type:complete len:497 (-),score=140.64,sp/Q54YZ0/UGPA2_DICDI/57.06/0.0,UDPGP/PF01704.13/4.9e-176,DUF4301/PF14134.1/3.8e+02,DUF4301/PF14134.1/0.11,DltD_C/PF04914.7/0.15 TRINITY_DN11178_c0_g1_i1:108-1598(-)